jgi:hypothetical protein
VTSYDAKPFDSGADFTLSEVNIVKQFSGGLIGVGSMRLILATEIGGAVHFTGMERVLGNWVIGRERSSSRTREH